MDMCTCLFRLHKLAKKTSLNMSILCVCMFFCAFILLCALTVWSVSGGRTMVFSMVFITSFHSSFNTRFSTVFSQILANKVRLAGGGRDTSKKET